MTPSILIVDDEDLIRWSLKERLEESGFEVREAGTSQEALAAFDERTDLVLLDYKLPDGNGLDVLEKMKRISAETPIILMTAHSSIDNAVAAMKRGAFHYANKPFSLDEMMILVEKALETTRLRRELRELRASQSDAYSVDRIVGESPPIRELRRLLRKIAASPATTVLLTGESGTGKDLAAKALHYASDRTAAPFMNITCSALPEALLESELFGHERGSFTDAKQLKKGLLELANGGTVFLDEIGEMSLVLQAKLLRFLEERRFRRVGGLVDIAVDVRVIAATNIDLEEAVRNGRFRPDLFYRLQVLPIPVPPLRERPGDIPLLAKHYVDAFGREFRTRARDVSANALERLSAYAWPGNVRELRNAVERAMLLAEGEILEPADFAFVAASPVDEGDFHLPADGLDFDRLERSLVLQALRRTGGNLTRAGALLGMNRDQIRHRIRKFDLAPAEYASR